MNAEDLIKIRPKDVPTLLGVNKAKLKALFEPSKYLNDIDMLKKLGFAFVTFLLGVWMLWSANYQSATTFDAMRGLSVCLLAVSYLVSGAMCIGAGTKREGFAAGLVALIGVVFTVIYYLADKQVSLYEATTDSDGGFVVGGMVLVSASFILFLVVCYGVYDAIEESFKMQIDSFNLDRMKSFRFIVPDSVVASMKDFYNDAKYDVQYTGAMYVSNEFNSAPKDVVYVIQTNDASLYLCGIGSTNKKTTNSEKNIIKETYMSSAELKKIRDSMKRMREE